jgi:hypothetical protein
MEALRSLKEKYSTEMEHMHRMNEEALVAVRVAEYESGTEVNRLREEYRTKFKSETSGMSGQVKALEAEAELHASKTEQASLCLNHLVVYTTQLEDRYARLSKAYNTLKRFCQSDERIMRGLDSLAGCCHATELAHGVRNLHDGYRFEPFLDPLEEISAAAPRTRVSFRVAVLHVLAALRFRYFMRERRQRLAAAKVSSSDTEKKAAVQLPPVYVLREKSSEEIAHMLLQAARLVDNTHSLGSVSNKIPLHQEMSMDEFDAYLVQYEREERSNTPLMVETNKSPNHSLLQALASPTSRARPGKKLTGNIYQLRNVSILYKTLTDMSNTIIADKAELEQLQVIRFIYLIGKI